MPICLGRGGLTLQAVVIQTGEMTVFGTDNQRKTMANTSKLIRLGLGGSSLSTASSQQTTCAIPASLRSLVMAIFLVLASPPMLHGAFDNGIEVISENYQISAQYSGSPPFPYPPPAPGSYSVSSSDGTPVSASGSSGGVGAGASIEGFSLNNHAYISATDRGIVSTSALGVWDFRPGYAFLNLNLAVTDDFSAAFQFPGVQESLTVTLTDTTTSTTLLSLLPNPDPYGYSYPSGDHVVPYDYTFGVNPSDVYELSVNASTGGYEYEWTEGVAASLKSAPTTDFVDFPDGGVTLGMLGMAVGGLAFIRRKLQVCG